MSGSFLRKAKICDGKTTTGTAVAHQLVTPSGMITVEASFTEGAATTCTALTIDIEGSITKDNWFALASHTFTSAERSAKCAMFHIVDKQIEYVRANITTLTKTGVNDVAVSVSILSAA
jgi:hypothetical protein